MSKKIIALLEDNNILSDELKNRYLRILKFLAKADLKRLEKLLLKQKKEEEKIVAKHVKAEGKFFENAHRDFQKFFKRELEKMVRDEVREDHDYAEELLKEIDK
mgnify:FL=1|jgi:hypothetical protein